LSAVATPDLPFTITDVENFEIIGQGEVDNQLVSLLVHTTVNANGTVTVDISDVEIECL
jgi:hypothetical protein